MPDTNSRVFNAMETVAADKTAVELFPTEFDKSTKGIHNALMIAGMTPAIGNVADLADATLYALEGEFGDAAWSSAAALPVIGQMVAGRKALKAAKESGEKMVTLYRGVDKWYPGQMVKKGSWVSPGTGSQSVGKGKGVGIWASTDILDAEIYGKRNLILEFEVPKKWYDKKKLLVEDRGVLEQWIDGGIPKGFLKKVHK